MLSISGLLGFVFSSALSRSSLFGRIGAFLFFLSIGFVFATKRVKMAPVELQLYYRFVRKQGVLGSTARAQEIDSPQTIHEAKPIVDHRPQLVRGLLDVGRPSARKRDAQAVAPTS
jgi:hypothetical protein